MTRTCSRLAGGVMISISGNIIKSCLSDAQLGTEGRTDHAHAPGDPPGRGERGAPAERTVVKDAIFFCCSVIIFSNWVITQY
jgi:hypothetical protein